MSVRFDGLLECCLITGLRWVWFGCELALLCDGAGVGLLGFVWIVMIAFLDRGGYVAWVVRFAVRLVFVGRWGIHIANFGFMVNGGFVYGLTRVASWLFVNNAFVAVLLLGVGRYWWVGVVVGLLFVCF